MMRSFTDAFAPLASSSALTRTRAASARVMSMSTVRKKCGTGPSDPVRRRATVLRIWVSGMSTKSSPGAGAATGTVGAAAAAWAAISMSRLTTRPPGPDPRTPAMSNPRSPARRFATGEAFTRPVAPGAG